MQEFLSGLGDPQVTHFLATWCINGSRLNYLARTTAPEFTQIATCDFGKAVVDTIGATCNVVLSDRQRSRAVFSTKEGSLGLRTFANETGAAYIASRNATHILVHSDQTQPTEGIKTRVISICKVPSMRWISWCWGWMWLRWSLMI